MPAILKRYTRQVLLPQERRDVAVENVGGLVEEHRFEPGQLLERPERRDGAVVVEVQLLQMSEGADLLDRIDAPARVDLQLLEMDELLETAKGSEPVDLDPLSLLSRLAAAVPMTYA